MIADSLAGKCQNSELVRSPALVAISVIIPTYNEETNLAQTLSSVVSWASQVVVFDSFSTDQTMKIAQSFGVEATQRKFDNFASHKNWALDNLRTDNPWILFLDADERLTPELRDEIGTIVSGETSCNGYYVARRNYFMGKWIRQAGMYPDWQLRLLRKGTGRYEERIVHEHMLVEGPTGYLKHPLEHEDFKGLERWFERHNRYTSMEAIEIRRMLAGDRSHRITSTLSSAGPERTRFVKEFGYRYLPCRALFVFIWMYVIRAGFLDGRIGFRYCLLKAFVDYQTSLKLLELQSSRKFSELIEPGSNQADSVDSNQGS